MVSSAIIKALPEHIPIIAVKSRQQDLDEFWAANYTNSTDAMRLGIKHSKEAWTGVIDGEPVCMFGVVQNSLLFSIGAPWFIGGSGLEKHPMTFLFRCREAVSGMAERFGKLENHVDARHKQAQKWLRFMGFTLHEKQPFGVLQLPFYRFTMEDSTWQPQ